MPRSSKTFNAETKNNHKVMNVKSTTITPSS
uniref:Uncharacterized protein n=1 Tax=Rhizophora mucronata TaxID=61149 RepID=A0A2P2PDG5_RHIMU